MAKVTQKQAEDTLNKNTKNVTKDDLQKVLDKQKTIEDRVKKKGPLNRFIEDTKLLFAITKDYAKGEYRAISWRSIAAIVATLLYVLNPIDLIPDIIPVLGQVDDALVVAACLAMVEADLQKYKEWKKRNE